MTTEPVGLIANLPAQRVMRAQVGDADIAIWRSRSGKIAAWENRCPHRGMRLSHGFVRGESLACLYHGWHYDRNGLCKYIPAHPDLDPPDTIRTTSFAVAEQGGLIWVSTGPDAAAPDLPEALRAVRSLTFECDIERVRQAVAGAPFVRGEGPVLTFVPDPDHRNILAGAAPDTTVEARVALQQPAPGACTAHLLAAEQWPLEELIRLSRWAETLRRRTEAAARATLSGDAQ